MNITDQDIYQGILMVNILRDLDELGFEKSVRFQTGTSKNSILVKNSEDEFLGIYIKYTKKNRSPWNFNFVKDHQEEIEILNELCKDCFIAFVCGTDGIALLSYNELKQLLDDNFEDSERIGINRKPRGNYWLKGRDGKLEKSVTNAELGHKLLAGLES